MSVAEEEQKKGIQQTWANRLVNILICRGDLAHEKLEAQPVALKELFRYSSKRDQIFVYVGVVLSILVGILQSTTCIVTGYVANIYLKQPTNQIGNDELWWSVIHWCIADGVLAVAMIVISYLQSWFFLTACTNIVRKMRLQYVKAVLRQDAAWFDGNDAGLISSQLNNNIERIHDGMADKFGLITRGFALFFFSTIFSFAVNWRVTLVSCGLGPLGAITMAVMAKCSAGPMKESMNATNEAGAIAEEAIMNVKTVAACNGQETMIQKYSRTLFQSLGKIRRLSFINGFFEGLMFFELYVFFVAGLLYGIVLYFNPDNEVPPFDPGTIIMAANTTQMGGYFLSLLGPHMMAVLKARVAAAVIYETIDRTPNIDTEKDGGEDLKNVRGKIEFEEVHFKYPTRETKILTGCSWTAEAGETIAFVGHSGCGKSTSIGLLTRLYDKVAGNIKIDGVEVEKISVKELRKTIGIVQQEPCLFNGTIKENIILGRNISDKKVEEAARIANAHEFIMKLQDGYETVLGVGGVALSGGQKQRIAIARAIAADPKILLLDEATSALDTESERVVQLALTKASRGRTTIVIAHRLSTLKDVNRIHVLDKGKVVEIGSHLELLAKDGLYATLAKAQEVGLNTQRSRKPSLSENFHLKTTAPPFMRSSLRSSVGERRASTAILEDDESTKGEEKEKKWSIRDFPLVRVFLSKEHRTLKILATFCAMMRGLELPAFSYFQILPFLCLEQTSDTYHHYLLWTCISFFALGCFTWFFLITAIGFGGWASEATVNNLRVGVLRSLLLRDAAYFDQPKRSNAACVTTLSLNSTNVNACLDYRFMLLVNNLMGVVVCLILTYYNTWQTGITSTILIGFFVFLLSLFSKGTDKQLKKKGKIDTTAEFAIEIFEQARTIQLLSVENYFTDRYHEQQELAKPIAKKLNKYQSATFMLTMSLVFISDFFCFLVGATSIYHGYCTAAEGVVAALTANFAGWSVIFASPTFNDWIKASSSARALFSLMGDEPSDIEDGLLPDLDGSVNVEKVSFAYPSRPDHKVARGLNLRVETGKSIALVGASGCGKSTIIQLLERFYSPDNGQIRMSNNNILDISLRHLRTNVALVGQEPVLFRGSIYENITLGCEPNVTIEDVKRVAEVSNAAKFIEAFPGGYDTDVGEKGRSLSGGQKQRIAIARALIRDPKLLLLDEATSALDTESEKKVQKALNEASSGRTSITIAHRLSTIRNANRIYFIENGGVVEYGTHDELIEADGKYARLVEAQALQTE